MNILLEQGSARVGKEMLSKDILLSVIIPTCHRNEDLTRCLQALQPEKLRTSNTSSSPSGEIVGRKNFFYEVIVADDGTVATAEPMLQIGFPWVKWHRGPRRGPAANRNFGASKAQGEWLLFLDDDCVPEMSWLEVYASSTNRFRDYSVFEGKTIAPGPKLRADHESPLNLTGGLLWSCNFGIKRHLFLQIGGFDEGFPVAAMEDMDLQARLQRAGYTSKYLPDACVQHPWRPRRGARFCSQLAKSIEYFTGKHPQARPAFAEAWGFKRMIKIVFVEFPLNLVRYREFSSLRVLGLDLITAVHVSLRLMQQRKQIAREATLSSKQADRPNLTRQNSAR